MAARRALLLTAGAGRGGAAGAGGGGTAGAGWRSGRRIVRGRERSEGAESTAWPGVLRLGYRPDMPGIVIVGAGFGGIGMGIALKKAGYHDFVILDKAPDLGGTWWDNKYPGCACDVPSPLYSYSFELNPDWTHLFAPQQEIWDYLRNCARKYDLGEHVRYGTAVERMDWDDRARRWNVETVQDGELRSFRARAVVSAAGALHLPSYPDIPGAG